MTLVLEALRKRFPNNIGATTHYGELLAEYGASGLAPPNMQQEVGLSERGLWAHVWEAMLYRYFRGLGFQFVLNRVLKAGQQGPDFGLLHQGATIWVEAIVPAPEGIPVEWLEPPQVGVVTVKSMPHKEMLLRWTAALKQKHKKFQRYLHNGLIAADEPTVIAINGCRLCDFAIDDCGISQMPFAVEATFPVGPVAVPISQSGGIDGQAYRVPRHSIKNANGAEVSTDNFLNSLYGNVSAVIGTIKQDMRYPLSLTVVHNPLAAVPLMCGIFRANNEYVADPNCDGYLLHPVHEV